MDYYFVDIKFSASVTVENHERRSFTVSENIKASKGTAKRAYLKQLKALSNELDEAISYIESHDDEYIPPVLLRCIHGRNNTDIDNEHVTETFGELK